MMTNGVLWNEQRHNPHFFGPGDGRVNNARHILVIWGVTKIRE